MKDFGFVADKNRIIATELGLGLHSKKEMDENHSYINPDYLERCGFSSWNSFSISNRWLIFACAP